MKKEEMGRDEVIVELPDFKLDFGSTERGFSVARFSDVAGRECSMQESSSILPRLWLGVDKPIRHDGPHHGMTDAQYKFLCDKTFRMHLSKSQVLAIGRAMVEWAEAQEDVVITDDEDERNAG
jgi:hypothetical protein